MTKKARLGLYLEDEETKKRIKIAAARRGISTTAYCAEAIRESLQRDMELNDKVGRDKLMLLTRMETLKCEIGPVGTTTAELVKEGRRR